jgi:hypothetical protein
LILPDARPIASIYNPRRVAWCLVESSSDCLRSPLPIAAAFVALANVKYQETRASDRELAAQRRDDARDKAAQKREAARDRTALEREEERARALAREARAVLMPEIESNANCSTQSLMTGSTKTACRCGGFERQRG